MKHGARKGASRECGLTHISGLFISYIFIMLCHQNDKVDLILKYMPDEARLLKAYNELPNSMRLNEVIVGGLDEDDNEVGGHYIEFEGEDIDKI
ncbi:hypothetical protein LIER_18255 [Lithospermum erythrorhizon]|uniref:Uncharacterized protein n=1 Tax=Lithospermum erythrorhizon TaxID=34254 RepID=A0AAV3QD93_LITER